MGVGVFVITCGVQVAQPGESALAEDSGWARIWKQSLRGKREKSGRETEERVKMTEQNWEELKDMDEEAEDGNGVIKAEGEAGKEKNR